MNYFELYPGDYLRDTTRLTLVEHGAYLRLLMAYYAEEQPLPADWNELFVAAGAISAADKAAVKKVADKYFPLGSDGLRHNSRADEELAKASDRMEGAEERRSNDAERKRRSRERRSGMFEALRAVGVVPDFDVTMDALRDLVSEHVTAEVAVTLGVTPRDKSRSVTRDGTATTRQTPHATEELGTTTTIDARDEAARGVGTPAGEAAAALNRLGVRITSQDPRLLEAVGEGVSTARLVELHRLYPDKPAGYLIAAARRQLAEAASSGATHATRPRSGKPSLAERVQQHEHDVIDGEARRVG